MAWISSFGQALGLSLGLKGCGWKDLGLRLMAWEHVFWATDAIRFVD